jgi:hypothetical protein
MNNNIIRCSKCNKELIAEETESHESKCHLITVKEIPVLFFFTQKNGDGKDIIIAKGHDGILYRLVKTMTR